MWGPFCSVLRGFLPHSEGSASVGSTAHACVVAEDGAVALSTGVGLEGPSVRELTQVPELGAGRGPGEAQNARGGNIQRIQRSLFWDRRAIGMK